MAVNAIASPNRSARVQSKKPISCQTIGEPAGTKQLNKTSETTGNPPFGQCDRPGDPLILKRGRTRKAKPFVAGKRLEPRQSLPNVLENPCSLHRESEERQQFTNRAKSFNRTSRCARIRSACDVGTGTKSIQIRQKANRGGMSPKRETLSRAIGKRT